MSKFLICVVALISSSAWANEDLDRNFTPDEFNAVWVREGGPDAMIQRDSAQSPLFASHPIYDERIVRIVRFGSDSDFAGFERATKPSLWLRFWSDYTHEAGAIWIANNPLLPNAIIGFSERCAEVAHVSLDTALKFSVEYLSKRAFLTNRRPDLTSADLDFIRGFHNLSRTYYGGRLPEVCKTLNTAYSLSQQKIIAQLKTAITITNREIHQCGSVSEYEGRLLKQGMVRSVVAYPSLEVVEYMPSAYDGAKNDLQIIGGTPPPSVSANECQPYYRRLADDKERSKKAEEQGQKAKKDAIKTSIINTQSIR